MKTAVVSDIHGNSVALKAALSHIPRDVDKLICLGDIVGYGPKPRQCVDKIREESDLTIKGNHEKALIRGETFNSTTAHYGLEYAKDELYTNHYQWLDNLPDKIEAEQTLIFHSHPKNEQHIYPDDVEGLIQNLQDTYQIVIYGHTHIPVNRICDETLVVNPGSIGQPRDSDRRLSYATIDTESKEAEIHRVEYDFQQTIQQLRDSGFPEDSVERILNAN